MVNIIKAKLEQHPRLVDQITKQGGSAWILSSTHQPTKQNSVWETGGKNWFIKSLNDAYVATNQPATSAKPLSLAQMADTGLTEKQEGTAPPAAPKTLTLAQMADVNAKEPMGLFEKLEANDFEEYTRAGGTELSKKDFLSLSAQEQANAIYQAKNC